MTPDLNGGASRVLPIRLSEIPVAIRREYGRKLMDEASENFDVLAGVQLNEAVENPTDKIYWIPVTPKSLPSIRRTFGKNWEYLT